MPKQNYYEPPEELAMSDCNLTASYTDQCALKDKRYPYPTYCLDCDRDVPRRRCLSESSEPYRKRGREMKSLSPRKYECRSRSNLCELPTSYIANNCAQPQPHNDNYDCLAFKSKGTAVGPNTKQSVVTDENNKLSLYLDSYDNMDDPYKTWSGLYKYAPLDSKNFSSLNSNVGLPANNQQQLKLQKPPHILEPRKQPCCVPKSKPGYPLKATEYSNYFDRMPKASECVQNGNSNSFGDMHFPPHAVPPHPHDFEHASFFNNKMDTELIKERYEKEVEQLRAKLRELKSSAKHAPPPPPALFAYREPRSKSPSPPMILHNSSNRSPNSRTEPPQSSSPLRSLLLGADLKRSRLSNDVLDVTKEVDAEAATHKNAAPVAAAVDSKNQNQNMQPPLCKDPLLLLQQRPKNGLKVNGAQRPRSKLSAVKLRKVRNKISNSLSSESDFTESDCSDSENSLKESDDAEDEEADDFAVFSHVNGGGKGFAEKPYAALPSVSSSEITTGSNEAAGDYEQWPIRASLFPNIPPYLKFVGHDVEKPLKLPPIAKYLKWKMSTITPIVVRKVLQNTGFRLVRKSNEWTGTWGKHMKSACFKTLKENQKLNHFPGTFQLGRKDRLWRNIQRLQNIHGGKEFLFIPHSYILPQDLKLLRQVWESKSGEDKWILKPPASARGTGIKVVHKWSQIPKRKSIVVQKYIADPFLINGSKFDLRLYVLVTSFNPLRIYLYPDGLVRFASVKYSDDISSLKDRYMHLTNYSINKLSSQYTANEDANAAHGHKWTISKLWEYLEEQGIDTSIIWKNLKHLVTKTMISGEPFITPLCSENMNTRYNCYELFGVDVLLDERLKAWLLEVNISPSLHSSSPLDAHVKGPLVENLLNIAQFHIPPRLSKDPSVPSCYDHRMYTTQLSKKEKLKQIYFAQVPERETYLQNILSDLTPDDVRHLTQAEDELVALGNFEKIFPTSMTYMYFQYMEGRYYNRLFDAWENKYHKDRQLGIKLLQNLCVQNVHLRCPSPTTMMKNSQSTIPGEQNSPPMPSAEGQSFPKSLTVPPTLPPLQQQRQQQTQDQQVALTTASIATCVTVEPM